jgi:plasmid stabilization system protein ParE
MTLITLEEADQEFIESVDYYESREAGLGLRFRNEVAAVVDWILRFPEVPRLRPRGYRRVNLRAFPHYVAYIIRGDTIWVVAIAHGHRRPEFWIERICISAVQLFSFPQKTQNPKPAASSTPPPCDADPAASTLQRFNPSTLQPFH